MGKIEPIFVTHTNDSMSTIGLICTLIGAIAVVLGGVWFIVQRAFKLGIDRNRLEQIEGKVCKLPCDEHTGKISRSEMDRYSLKETLEKLSENIQMLPCESRKEQISETQKAHKDLYQTVMSTNDMVTEISKWVMKSDADMINQLVKKCSPFRITPVGEIIFEKSGAKKAVDVNQDKLISLVENTEPKTPYDVENNASSILIQNIGDDMFHDIKNFLYYSPDKISVLDPTTDKKIEVSLSIHALIKIMSIYLRDKYFEKHPEIDITDFY